MKDFYKKRVVVVTGAGSGMGREIAIQLSKTGASLALNDWNEKALEETTTLLGLDSKRLFTKAFDVGKREEVYNFAVDVVNHFGHVDVVINNAGIALVPKTIDRTSYEDFEKVVNVNMWGMIYGTKAFLPYLKERPSGAIANVSSVFGMMGYPSQGPYVTTKFAIRGFTETLRIELVNTNITVSSIHPGGIKTNIVRNIDQIDQEQKDEMAKGFEEVAPTTANEAATIILKGIAQKKARILIGKDARSIDRFTRIFPSTYEKYILKRIDNPALFDDE